MEEQTFTIILNNKSKISRKFDYEGAMDKYNSLISSKKYTTIKIIDADKNVIEEWEEEDGADIQIKKYNEFQDIKTIQENIQMNDENTSTAKKRGRKPKLLPEKEEKKVEEIKQSILEDYKNQMERNPLPPYLEKEIAEHKEGCECDLCGVAKVVLECRQEDIKELVKEIPELVPPTTDIFVPDTDDEVEDAPSPQASKQKATPSPKTKEMETQTDDLSPNGDLVKNLATSCEISNFECLVCSSKRKSDDPDYWKKYYEANKEKLKEQKKKWRDANKDKVNSEKKKEYQKKYDAKNKEKIKARRERLIVCECGEQMKAFSLRKHKTSKIHKIKVELKIARGETIVETPIEEDEDNSSTSTLSS
jgi:hypothetical protein